MMSRGTARRAALALPLIVALAAGSASASGPSGWSTPETLAASELGSGGPPTPLALAPDGVAVAVWSQITLAGYGLFGAGRPSGAHWQAPVKLPGEGIDPQVALDASANAIAVWQSSTPPFAVQASMRPAGGGWLPPAALAAAGGEQPHIAENLRGDSVVVWSRTLPRHLDDAGGGIEAAVRKPGAAFAPAQSIVLHENAHDPIIAMNERGDAAAAWEVDGPQGCRVWAAYRRANGHWGRPHRLSNFDAGCPAETQLAIDANGEAIVAWLAQRGEIGLLEDAVHTAGDRWLERRVLAGARVVYGAHVAMDARGDAIVVFSELIGNTTVIATRTRPAGQGWGRTQAVPRAFGGPASVAMDARGDVLLTWTARGPHVEASARPAGGRWRRTDIRSPREPSVTPALAALDAHGDGLLAWQDEAGIETSWHPSLFR
jgi:hypothetical protein